MKKNLTTRTLALGVLLVLVFGGPALVAQEKSAEQKKAEAEAIQKRWIELTTVSEKHKHLEYFVGQWESEQKAESATGTVVYKQKINVVSQYGGLFTLAHIQVFAPGRSQAEFEGYVITGHDNYLQKYFSVTYGNYDTIADFMTGTLDETGKIRTDFGDRVNRLTGEKYQVKAITNIIDADNYTYTFYRLLPGSEPKKSMEITYHRIK